LAAGVPAVGAGMDHVREAASAGGALSAGHKALFQAAAAAAKGLTATLRESVARARAADVPAEEAWAAAGLLALARGEEVAARLVAVVLATYGPPAEPAASDDDPHIDHEGAVSYFHDYFGGGLPERVAALAERSTAAFEGYALLHRSGLRQGALQPKLAELLLCAVNAAELRSDFVEIHARSARSQGATADELFETVLSAVPVAGIAAWAASASVLSNP
jgi:alkylhydroperoxidase/carboxymuconolactone decarboxylase family protein YurZ